MPVTSFKKCNDPCDLDYRHHRVNVLAKEWNLNVIRPLILEYRVPEKLMERMLISAKSYVYRCLQAQLNSNEGLSCSMNLDNFRDSRTNITPNGACVPKEEFQFLYNDVLKTWFEIFQTMIEPNEQILKLVRVTPNIRIKFGRELSDNIDRGLNTQLPHSDAWVEGPWGFNVFAPLFGDCANNTLRYFKLPNGPLPNSFFSPAPSYEGKQILLGDFLEDETFVPKAGHVYISDYAVVHKTWRSPGCAARVSIDTTLMAGDHDVHPDRRSEYLSAIPEIGKKYFFQVIRSENEERAPGKKTVYSHYTTGNIKLHMLNG
ncbi:hypothetical protein N9V13_05545 [Betaproteobacteria bacterium]|nr:hypothetical protein [Betaproteobacteria bacterium]